MHITYLTCCSNLMDYNLSQNLRSIFIEESRINLMFLLRSKFRKHYCNESTKVILFKITKSNGSQQLVRACMGCEKKRFYHILPSQLHKWSNLTARPTQVPIHQVIGLTGQARSSLITIQNCCLSPYMYISFDLLLSILKFPSMDYVCVSTHIYLACDLDIGCILSSWKC